MARAPSGTRGKEIFTAAATVEETSSSREKEMEVLTRSVIAQFEQYVIVNKKVPPEMLAALAHREDGPVADAVARR